MNLNDYIAYRWLRLGAFHQLHPGRSRSLVRHHYRLHVSCPLSLNTLPQVGKFRFRNIHLKRTRKAPLSLISRSATSFMGHSVLKGFLHSVTREGHACEPQQLPMQPDDTNGKTAGLGGVAF
jgi:hypothetical protein